MKPPIRSLLFTVIALAFAVCLGCTIAQAQDPAPVADASSATTEAVIETAGAVAQPFIVSFAQSHPWLLTALAAIAALRLVFKPIMSAAQAYVKSTASTSDDAFLEKVEHSRAYKIAAWLLDYLGSIKVGPQKEPAAKPNPQS